MRKSSKESWLDLVDPFWGQYFQISNKGRLKSKDYQTAGRIVYGRIYVLTQIRRGLLVGILNKRVDGISYAKTIYIGMEVAKAYLIRPEPIVKLIQRVDTKGYYEISYGYNFVINKSGNNTNNEVWNLKWATRDGLNTIEGIGVSKGREEEWKPVTVVGSEADYEVSNFGRMRSIERLIFKMNHCCKNPYEELFHSRIMKLRDNKVHPHLFATLQRLNDKGEKVTASAYIAKEVAIAFIKKPKEKQAIYDPKRNRFKEYEYVYVENIDGDRTNNYDWNLRWITPYDLHLKQKANGKKFIMDLYKHSPIWQNRKNK